MRIIVDRQDTGMEPNDTCTISRVHMYKDWADGKGLIVASFWGLEDDFDPVKERGHTRISAGIYKMGFRTVGGFFNRYSRRYPGFKGMPWVLDVPNYKYILVHIGNDEDDTAGCLLIGLTVAQNRKGIYSSRKAFEQFYLIFCEGMESAEGVTIEYRD